MQKIDSFDGQYRFLSNFFHCEVEYEGQTYPSSEHAYQAAKSLNPTIRRIIAKLATAGDSKKYGQKIAIRKDWDEIKIPVMMEILRNKFKDPLLQQKLKLTFPTILIEGNWWGDTFWGVCKGIGRNELGKALMSLREEYVNAKNN